MRRDTDRRRIGRGAPILAAAGTVLVMGVSLITLALEVQAEPPGRDTGMVVLAAIALLAVIAGVVAAAVQRLREMRRGELDDARRY